ncbi:MAG: hypothetical protein QOF33_3510 [Thermomicrobiales bacterium]|nr:hypothetical protein [Thermomicrobiales bacterium]
MEKSVQRDDHDSERSSRRLLRGCHLSLVQIDEVPKTSLLDLLARPLQHRLGAVDSGHAKACLGNPGQQSAGAAAKLENRVANRFATVQVEVDIVGLRLMLKIVKIGDPCIRVGVRRRRIHYAQPESHAWIV